MLFTAALPVRLKREEDESAFGVAPPKLKPATENVPRISGMFFCDGRNLPSDIAGVVERSSGWGLNGDDEITLILGRHEALGHTAEDQESEAEAEDEEDESDDFEAQDERRARTYPLLTDRSTRSTNLANQFFLRAGGQSRIAARAGREGEKR